MMSMQMDAAVRERLSASEHKRLRRRLGRMMRAAALSDGSAGELEASFRFTDDGFIHELNRVYRGRDCPTDVLAFAQREGEGAELCPEILGDVVISVETAERQAKESLFDELLFLAAHGLCHLLGYDHRDDAEEATMNARMANLLAESGGRGRVRSA